MVGDRVDQHLEQDPRPVAIAGQQRHHRGQVAARAVAADRDARRIEPEARGVGRHPQQSRVGVLDRRRVLELGREPVVHRRDRAAGRVDDGPADAVVGVEVADHPAAAVVEDQHRMRADAGGLVHAHRDLAAGDRHAMIGHRGHLLERAERGGARAHGLAGFRRGGVLERLQVERGEGVDDLPGLRIEWHVRLPPGRSREICGDTRRSRPRRQAAPPRGRRGPDRLRAPPRAAGGARPAARSPRPATRACRPARRPRAG